MESYIVPIKSAFFAFPFIALLFTIPYMAVQYKKFGGIPFLRTAILYSFILYLVNMYLFVILPLPPVDEVSGYAGSAMQLIPFQFVDDFIQKSNFDITNPGTYVGAFTDSSFFVVLFNILLFVPLGIYLRYYFKWSWKKTLLSAFGISLFFELTQLSGLYTIYPQPYRLFDVDDLMLNTLGGMAGYWMTPVICHFLPSRDRIDEMAYEKGERVPLFRRVLALAMDWITLGVFTSVLWVVLHTAGELVPFQMFRPMEWLFEGVLGYALLVALYFMVLPYFSGGYTFGKWFFRMKLVNEKGGKPVFLQYLVRYGILYGVVFSGPLLIVGSILLAARVPRFFSILLALFVLFISAVWLLFLWESLAQFFGRPKDYYYGRLSHTRNKNMIRRRGGRTKPFPKKPQTDGLKPKNEKEKEKLE